MTQQGFTEEQRRAEIAALRADVKRLLDRLPQDLQRRGRALVKGKA